ncbi:hypothetical protein GX50_08996 [[Emmonsia] crescens]|uniref:Myb-like domain-containing protein n=1 Tax=[Emmonsia] crescens TaxID=73230 RepID=A0A2B7YDZ6_9EURO|nr:hypothetical protein GX50_08996 [Emmonsia crescens]
MLLPSALSCDSRQSQHQQHHHHQYQYQYQYQYPTRSRFTTSRLFPSTPPTSSDDGLIAGNGLLGTCRALQSLLNTSPAPSPSPQRSTSTSTTKPAQQQQQRLQSPLHVVVRPPQPGGATRAQKVVKKQKQAQVQLQRVVPITRGINTKRRRDVYEDDDCDMEDGGDGFSTPKRRRRAPEELPLGLVRADFRSLEEVLQGQGQGQEDEGEGEGEGEGLLSSRSQSQSQSQSQFQSPSLSPSLSLSPEARRRRRECDDDGTDDRCGCDGEISLLGYGGDDEVSFTSSSSSSSFTLEPPSEDWTSEDDKRLVELVLEKLKLSKRDWNECARRMGRDDESVGRRWKALVGEGNVGLRRGRRMVRGRIHESWRCDG